MSICLSLLKHNIVYRNSLVVMLNVITSVVIRVSVCLQSFEIPLAQMYHLLDYTFSDFVLDDDDTIKACIRMFVDLQLLERFHISYEVCYEWCVVSGML